MAGPALCVVPMGWKSPVTLVQYAVTLIVLDLAQVPRSTSLEKGLAIYHLVTGWQWCTWTALTRCVSWRLSVKSLMGPMTDSLRLTSASTRFVMSWGCYETLESSWWVPCAVAFKVVSSTGRLVPSRWGRASFPTSLQSAWPCSPTHLWRSSRWDTGLARQHSLPPSGGRYVQFSRLLERRKTAGQAVSLAVMDEVLYGALNAITTWTRSRTIRGHLLHRCVSNRRGSCNRNEVQKEEPGGSRGDPCEGRVRVLRHRLCGNGPTKKGLPVRKEVWGTLLLGLVCRGAFWEDLHPSWFLCPEIWGTFQWPSVPSHNGLWACRDRDPEAAWQIGAGGPLRYPQWKGESTAGWGRSRPCSQGRALGTRVPNVF